MHKKFCIGDSLNFSFIAFFFFLKKRKEKKK